MRRRRVVALVAIVASLAALASADRDADRTVAVGPEGFATVRGVMPVTAPPGALTSTWYCAGGTSSAQGAYDHYVVIANPTDETVSADVTVYPGTLDGAEDAATIAQTPPATASLRVAARSRAVVRLADVLQAPFASALVEVSGGGAAVEHQIHGDRGFDATPCASAPSAAWYFPIGVTTVDARETLVLFNPFPDDAVVDLTFATSDGFRAPQPYEGFVVPGGRVIALDIGAVVARHGQVAATILARTGRLVIDRIQSFDGSATPRSIDVSLGSAVTSEVWLFPNGQTGEGLTEVITIQNPGERQAEIDIEIQLDDPATNGEAEPIAVSVAPGGYTQVDLGQEQRVPPGVGHSLSVRSQNGVPVVAERLLAARGGRNGTSLTLGSPLMANEWVFASGEATAQVAEFLVVQNPSSDSIARFSVRALANGVLLPIEGLTDVEVAPASRIGINLGEHINRRDLALVVESRSPVAVERALYAASGPGLSLSSGVPVSTTARRAL